MTKTPKKQQNQKPQMPKNNIKGSIILCWCDNGTTDGKFTEGVVYSSIMKKIPIESAMRVQGNQIGRQRQNAFDFWLDKTDFEWILWVDSDIVLNPEALLKVWSSADKISRPVVTGTYFVSKENEATLMTPYPALWNWTDNEYSIAYLHPLPFDSLVEVGCSGFGFLLMHRSVGKKMRDHHGERPFFNETGIREKFISEDINFFRAMKDAGIPLHAHTGALVQHMKRFSFDVWFYKMYWEYASIQEKRRAENDGM